MEPNSEGVGVARREGVAATSSEVLSRSDFAVNMTCGSCEKAVREVLQKMKENDQGVVSFSIDLPNKRVIVDATCSSDILKSHLSTTGRKVALMGSGTAVTPVALPSTTATEPAAEWSPPPDAAAAVCALGYIGETKVSNIVGMVRFVQVEEKQMVIEATVDGLVPGNKHGLHIHEFGDFSEGCASTGGHYNPRAERHGGPPGGDKEGRRHAGDLGNLTADANGRAVVRLVARDLQVWELVGRAVVVHAGEDDLGKGGDEESLKTGNAGARVACGVIARAAAVGSNPKRFCACSGKTLWEEEPLIKAQAPAAAATQQGEKVVE